MGSPQLRRIHIRMSEALYAEISNEALRRGHSINIEIVRRCTLKRWTSQADWEMGYRSGGKQHTIEELGDSRPF